VSNIKQDHAEARFCLKTLFYNKRRNKSKN